MNQRFTSWGNEKGPKGRTIVSSLSQGVEGSQGHRRQWWSELLTDRECLPTVLLAWLSRLCAGGWGHLLAGLFSLFPEHCDSGHTVAIPWCWRCGSSGSGPTVPNRTLGQLTSGDSENSRNLPEEHSPGSRRDLRPVVWWPLVMSGRCSRHGVPYLHSTDFLDCYHQGHEQPGSHEQ